MSTKEVSSRYSFSWIRTTTPRTACPPLASHTSRASIDSPLTSPRLLNARMTTVPAEAFADGRDGERCRVDDANVVTALAGHVGVGQTCQDSCQLSHGSLCEARPAVERYALYISLHRTRHLQRDAHGINDSTLAACPLILRQPRAGRDRRISALAAAVTMLLS